MILNSSVDIEKAKSAYANAEPFKFCVIDDFLAEPIAELLHKDMEYLIPDSKWVHYDSPIEKKYATNRWDLIPALTRTVLMVMNTSVVMDTIEEISGIKGLLPDPDLRGAGLHVILPGGKLLLHSDRQKHPTLNIYRRLNAIIYLNKDWKDSWNGHLEMWDRDITECKHKIAPVFNRFVLFETTAMSWHGHPEVLNCPIGTSRKSLALYYWTSTIPDNFEINEGSTDFRSRPGENEPEVIKLMEERRRAPGRK